MPRKTQTDDDNEKKLKPKEQFRLSIEIHDDGYIDYTFKEWYVNEVTGKRKQLIHESPNKFKESIKNNLGEDTDKLAAWILDGLGIEPNAYARRVCDLPQTYDEKEYSEAMDHIEEMEDAKGGENLP